jgi:hypothetical protein
VKEVGFFFARPPHHSESLTKRNSKILLTFAEISVLSAIAVEMT